MLKTAQRPVNGLACVAWVGLSVGQSQHWLTGAHVHMIVLCMGYWLPWVTMPTMQYRYNYKIITTTIIIVMLIERGAL